MPSPSTPRLLCSPAGTQRLAWPAWHCAQLPQEGTKQNATRSPAATCATPAPTASTVPAPSWPSTIGCRSLPEVPVRQMHVGVADAGRGDPHQHLAGAGRRQLQLLHRQGRAHLAQHRSHDSHATRHRSSASRSGSTPSPGPGGGAMVPSPAISTTSGQHPVAPFGRPGGRVVGHLHVAVVGQRAGRVQVRDQPVAVRPGVRRPAATQLAGEVGDPPAAADAAAEQDVALDHRDAAAGQQVARLVLLPHHLPGRDRHAGGCRPAPRSRRRRRWAAAPPASGRGAARAPRRTRGRWRGPRPERGRPASANPGSRRP